jgi:hypothetical protein
MSLEHSDFVLLISNLPDKLEQKRHDLFAFQLVRAWVYALVTLTTVSIQIC